MWEFSVGLYMINIWPNSLLLAAVYGVVESASTAFLGPSIGQWLDRLTYVKVCSTSILCAFDTIWISVQLENILMYGFFKTTF